MKHSAILLGLALTLVSVACEDDEVVPTCDPCPPQIENLTQRVHVLNNIEYAYNQRRIEVYDGVLDANFTFFLSPGDVGAGLPAQWDRQEEIRLNTSLLDKGYTGPNACQRIEMDIRTEDGVQWAANPSETWYTTTLYYVFTFEIAPNTYSSAAGSKARFTVRNAGTDAAPHWQLVEMEDLGGGSLFSSRIATSTESSSWGQVKALYR